MPFNVGDVVRVQDSNRGCGRIRQILPRTLSVQDFQEYVVEFTNWRSERFRFGVCREFQIQLDSSPDGIEKK